jgi:PRC-barrel domain
LTAVNDNHGFPCMLFGHEGVESMLMTKLVLAAAIAFAISTTAAAQTPEGVPLLKTLPADGTTIANYYKQNVYDPADQKIGQILDLVIKKDGAVPAAIVSVGGFLGIATKYVAVPFTALQATPAGRRTHLVLDTSKKALRNAPAFAFNRLTRRWERLEDD